MFNHIIKTRSQRALVLQRSKAKAFLEISVLLFFVAFWYKGILADFSSLESLKAQIVEKIDQQILYLVFLLAPLVLAKRLWLGITTLALGNRYTFNFITRTISHNGRRVCRYDEVDCIRISRHRDSDNDDFFSLHLLHSDGKKLFIAESADYAYIRSLASDMANVSGSQIQSRD